MSNKLNLYFLGTSASVPTKERNLTSVLLNYKGINYLFDAPENVQQQIYKAGQSILKIKHIFITHFHGDHFYGLPGLLSSMSLNRREEDLFIYVPLGFKTILDSFLKSAQVNLTFNLFVKEVKSNLRIPLISLTVTAIKLNHTILSFGYLFKINDKIGKFNKQKALKLKIPEGPLFSKLQAGKSIRLNGRTIYPKEVIDSSFKKIGKKILYMTDTSVLKKPSKLLNSPDILIHECTFSDNEKERAKERLHSYFSEVFDFSKKINAKNTYIVHISSKYKTIEDLTDGKKISSKSFIFPKDLDVLELSDF